MKIAKAATGNADIGDVDVAVDDPAHFIPGNLFLPAFMGSSQQFASRGGIIQIQSFLYGERLKSDRFMV
jgi:hypothetical protein